MRIRYLIKCVLTSLYCGLVAWLVVCPPFNFPLGIATPTFHAMQTASGKIVLIHSVRLLFYYVSKVTDIFVQVFTRFSFKFFEKFSDKVVRADNRGCCRTSNQNKLADPIKVSSAIQKATPTFNAFKLCLTNGPHLLINI